MKKTVWCLMMASMIGLTGCKNYLEGNHNAQMLYAAFFSMAPILNPLAISGVSNNTITLAQPTFTVSGSPGPTVDAYIGLDDGSMTISGSTVGGAIIEGPVDVSSGPYQFLMLSPNTVYRIYVVAANANGYSVRYITQGTSYIAPVLNALVISTTTPVDSGSITIDQPSLSTAGNPAPTVYAYIGEAGGGSPISVTGGTTGYTVSNDIPSQSGQDVSTSGCSFTSLSADTLYRIYVVADNIDISGNHHQSIVYIDQSTTGVAPVLDAASFSINSFDDTSITIVTPGFSLAGNPTTSPVAYIGYSSNISSMISGATVTVTGYVQGPVVLSGGPGALYTFSGLYANTAYTVIITAENGISPASPVITSVSTPTTGTPPQLNGITGIAIGDTSITFNTPTFADAGNPATLPVAYIGPDDGSFSIIQSAATIAITGTSLKGPILLSGATGSFTGLSPNTAYRIYVVAENGITAASVVSALANTTTGTPAQLNGITGIVIGDTTIGFNTPTFADPGNPTTLPVAYIGPDDGSFSITQSGTTIAMTGTSVQGPVLLSGATGSFTGLSPNTAYRIYVVAENGVTAASVVSALANTTTGTPAQLNGITGIVIGDTSIGFNTPTFADAGNPVTLPVAYIGPDDGSFSIAANGAGITITGTSLQGPVLLAGAAGSFTGLSPNTAYRIYVVAENGVADASVVSALANTTTGTPTQLNNIDAASIVIGSTTIAFDTPTFADAGNPVTLPVAYIGPDDGSFSIAASGATIAITGTSLQGPVLLAGATGSFTGLAPDTVYRIYVVAENGVADASVVSALNLHTSP